ncbi:hypothetical protein LSH36_150g05032 [Paralvinella palmiformis]|uniref:Splicing factor 3A subunit 3 n=1 Tax=Paralvinella palmiformis TaxID=53620 RepID=A0AAD9N750_9ANNE|nr:hypothetical protein LSH36_150g05032 [Paralvinella palmiformis]
METLLEQQRRYHEERERLTDSMVKELLHPKKTFREQINADHRLKLLLDRHTDCSAELRDLYEDKDGLRKEEIAALSGPNEFAEFYTRLKSLKDFHKKHPNEISVPMAVEFEELDKLRENPDESAAMVDFTDEEGYGRYLDMHECYIRFINLKGIERIDYVTYLEIFDRLFDIPKERKNAAYKSYLLGLLTYLEDYCSRVKPLLDLSEEMSKVNDDFDKQWIEGSFPGWPKEATGALTHLGAHLDLSAFSSWEELASLGLDRLKSALMALGLKCGGTLEERAQRLFSTKGKKLDELDPALFAKSKPGKAGKANRLIFQDCWNWHVDPTNPYYELSNLVADYCFWQPIPYWLYKLHGLNISYNCEICGNHTYRGPKAFQRHFAEEYEDSSGNVFNKKTFEDLKRQGLL